MAIIRGNGTKSDPFRLTEGYNTNYIVELPGRAGNSSWFLDMEMFISKQIYDSMSDAGKFAFIYGLRKCVKDFNAGKDINEKSVREAIINRLDQEPVLMPSFSRTW
ncbi:MAG: hypothetical protein GDA50_00100 [Alphaproteobacteria bacterium GM202ARS2]|nr:hypothetical protein [Alphaproteobacteria bacterium GM202ARS2]